MGPWWNRAVAAALLAGCSSGDDGPPPTAEAAAPPPALVLAQSVIDGDTIRVELTEEDLEPVRLIGINAPERGECLAEEASVFLAGLVEGREVRLVADISDRDSAGRLLRYVYLGELFVNETVVREGLAIARRYRPDTAMAGALDSAQAEARTREVGMWRPGACGPAGRGLRIVEVRYDPPGDDALNPNGEWVSIENAGQGPVDLTGWMLRDESASHRYAFPDGLPLLAGASLTVFTGCGADSPSELYWCVQGSAVWNNSGDTAFLVDPSGNIVDRWSYGPDS
ncbi:MAG: lamin tail domain-containing protein [Acidimicrobiia bacterium]